MSAPAMKLSALPEKKATARTCASRSSAVSMPYISSFTDWEITLTGAPGLSSVTTAIAVA